MLLFGKWLFQCLPGNQILKMRGYNMTSSTGQQSSGSGSAGSEYTLTIDQFASLCPALLYQLTMTPCIYHPHTFLTEKTTAHPVSATNEKPYLGR